MRGSRRDAIHSLRHAFDPINLFACASLKCVACALVVLMATEKSLNAKPKGAESQRAESKYLELRDAVRAFRKNKKAMQYRDSYAQLITRAKKYRKEFKTSSRADDALYIIASLREDLGRVSFRGSDFSRSINTYLRVANEYPKSNLCDDALMHAANLMLTKTQEKEKGLKLYAQVARGPKSWDMTASARRQLDKLSPGWHDIKTDEKDPTLIALSSGPKVETKKEKITQKLVKQNQSESHEEGSVKVVAKPANKVAVGPVERGAEKPAEKGTLVAKERSSRVNRRVQEQQQHHQYAPSASAELGERAKSELGEQAKKTSFRISKIMVDPGHGGKDTGAIGQKGTLEKSVVMSIANELAKELRAQIPGVEVRLTRQSDTYIPLKERTAMANEWGADLFISVHANANPNRDVHGIETYTLNTTDDKYAKRLAGRENIEEGDHRSDLEFILADLAVKSNTDDSIRLGRKVHDATVQQLQRQWPNVADLGLKQALFYVLLGAKMPAILVETSFLSNARDEKRLMSPKYRQKMAKGLARGVHAYVYEHEQKMARLP